MRFHPELGPTPTVGVELEVARWRTGHSMEGVAAALEAAGLMPSKMYSRGRHDYHCTCNVCVAIGTQTTFPVMFKLQRDASLPRDGGEFISSPFPLDTVFLDQAVEAYLLVGEAALPPDDHSYTQRTDEHADVGLHVHSYASGPDLTGMSDGDVDLAEDAAETFLGFAPELFKLAACNNAGTNRPLRYRLTLHNDSVGKDVGKQPYGFERHHLFITRASVRRRDGGTQPHVEWRFWEMPYADEEYFRGAIIISAALTQILHRRPLVEKMFHLVSLMPWNDDSLHSYDAVTLLERFSPRRFNLLRRMILEGTGLVDDEVLCSQAERMLDRVSRPV